MFIPDVEGAAASTVSGTLPTSPTTPPAQPPTLPSPPEQVRHMLFGTPSAVGTSIRHLHKLGYAEVNDWSRPISTGRVNEVMAILTKRVSSAQ